MATKFLEPGGDADFLVGTTNGFWSAISDAPAVATDFVHGGHIKSIKYRPGAAFDYCKTASGVLADSGSRLSVYLYFVAFSSSIGTPIALLDSAGSATKVSVRVTSGGIIQLWNGITAQIGTNGSTISTGVWYRISLAYTITSTTVNRFEVFVNGVSSISVTNGTLSGTGTSVLSVGNRTGASILDFRSSDHYIDNSSSLTDTGDIWVTAKRPVSNGTTNGFTTQIGAGGSGYGTGHSPQVNERALSTTNGWSMIGAGAAVTEEYNIEADHVGDIDITGATIVDYLGWVSTKALVAETGQIIVDGASTAISITTTAKLFTKIKGSSTYPAGTGADIGMQTDTSLTTVSLYECGVIVAYIPSSGTNIQINISDVWKSVSGVQINIGDVWKPVTKAQINIGDVWKTIF